MAEECENSSMSEAEPHHLRFGISGFTAITRRVKGMMMSAHEHMACGSKVCSICMLDMHDLGRLVGWLRDYMIHLLYKWLNYYVRMGPP